MYHLMPQFVEWWDHKVKIGTCSDMAKKFVYIFSSNGIVPEIQLYKIICIQVCLQLLFADKDGLKLETPFT